MSPQVLEDALRRAGAQTAEQTEPPLTKTDMAAMGLSGTANASALRLRLQKHLGLPENLSSNALLQALNCLYSREEILSAVRSLQEQGGEVSHDGYSGGI